MTRGWSPIRRRSPSQVGTTCTPKHTVEPLTDVRGVHGASRDIDGPCSIGASRQISAHSVEPIAASLSRNLLSHDDRGPGGTDEAKEVGPQMPWIVGTSAFAGDRERLARAGAGPHPGVAADAPENGSQGPL